jgi:hypothetical protein
MPTLPAVPAAVFLQPYSFVGLGAPRICEEDSKVGRKKLDGDMITRIRPTRK